MARKPTSRARREPTDLSRAGVDAASTSLVGAILDRYAATFLFNELEPERVETLSPGAVHLEGFVLPSRAAYRRDTAVEQLHHARVSLRRLRSILRTYGYLFSREWSRPLIRELSWFAGVLGAVRDLEVMRDAMTRALGDDASTPEGAHVLALVDAAIDAANEVVIRERRGDRYAGLIEAVEGLRSPAHFSQRAKAPSGRALRDGLRHAWRDVKRAARRAERRATARRLHQLRIELKRLQYAAEAVIPVYGEPVEHLAESAEHLQTRLGRANDDVVARRWLKSLEVDDDAILATVERLRTRHRRELQRTLKEWRHEFNDLARTWAAVGL